MKRSMAWTVSHFSVICETRCWKRWRDGLGKNIGFDLDVIKVEYSVLILFIGLKSVPIIHLKTQKLSEDLEGREVVH